MRTVSIERWRFCDAVASTLICLVLGACASTAKRPTRAMIFASAAMKGADRAQSEKRSPDFYRRAENSYWKATRLYLAKEFEEASKAALDARRLAEMAEMDAELRMAQSAGDEEQ